jgi:hypothetical protein
LAAYFKAFPVPLGLGLHVTRGLSDHLFDQRARTIVITDGKELFCQRQLGFQRVLSLRKRTGNRDGLFTHVKCQRTQIKIDQIRHRHPAVLPQRLAGCSSALMWLAQWVLVARKSSPSMLSSGSVQRQFQVVSARPQSQR